MTTWVCILGLQYARCSTCLEVTPSAEYDIPTPLFSWMRQHVQRFRSHTVFVRQKLGK